MKYNFIAGELKSQVKNVNLYVRYNATRWPLTIVASVGGKEYHLVDLEINDDGKLVLGRWSSWADNELSEFVELDESKRIKVRI